MRYSILFVVVLILVSGLIAYIADLLGRWLGKKRLTIGRLRPRHTAYAVNIVTGMLISALAVITLMMASQHIRKVVTQGDQLIQQNETLTLANARLARVNKGLQTHSRELQESVRKLRVEANAARKEAAKAESERDKQLQLVNRLRGEVADRMKEIAARRTQLAKLEQELGAVRNESTLARAELAARSAELETVQASLKTTEARLQTASSKLSDAQDKLQAVEGKLAKAEVDLRNKQKEIEFARETVMLQGEAIRNVGLQALKFRTDQGLLLAQAEILRSGRLVLKQGDEIIRGTISPKQSLFGIKADLLSLLDSAGDKAKEAGAGDGSSERAVYLIFRQQLDKERFVFNEDESANIQRAAETIARSPIDALVQVVCARNSLAGERVPVEFVLYINKLVYLKGDLIAHTEMDGRVSEGRILLSLLKFMREDLSRAGLNSGIVPISNPDSSIHRGIDQRAQVEGLMLAVDQVKSKNARVTVNSYACRDIYAGDQLNMTNMRFGVAKIE